MAVQTKKSAPGGGKVLKKSVNLIHSSRPPTPTPEKAAAHGKADTAAPAPLLSESVGRKAEPRIARGRASGHPRMKSGGRKVLGPIATLKSTISVGDVRKRLGLTQELFARLIGVTQRSVTNWENGGEINDVSLRRVREMDHLAEELKKSMREDFIPQWLVSPNEGLGGISPIEAMERGEAARVWRSVFLMGSGIPI